MHVEGLLRAKGDAVVTVTSTATVADAVGLLVEHRIGAVVVSDDGTTIQGIVSERDVVVALAGGGRDILDDLVTTIMTAEVITCDPTTTVHELMTVMTERRTRHIPVVMSGNLGGIVSIGDVVKDRIRDLEVETQTLHDYIAQGR